MSSGFVDLLQEVNDFYDGTGVIVSHDRDFLDRAVTVTLCLDVSGHVDVVAGGYEDWEAKRRPRNAGKTTARKDASSPPPPKQQTKLSYKDQRDYELLPRRVEELEAQIGRAHV